MAENMLILASLSIYRAQILRKAGLKFSIEGAHLDERKIEEEERIKNPEKLSSFLARTKAKNVSDRFPKAWVIGCDQVLDLKGQVLHKVTNYGEAYERLCMLSGKKHVLHSSVSLFQFGKEIFSDISSARMTMRPLSEEFIKRYLTRVGTDIFKSVGVYQIEGEGIHLFEKIEGDFFTIVGLPLLPLLAKLRSFGIVDG